MPDDALQHLMDALVDLRRFWERPDRKRRFLAELGEPVELGVLRTLTAVHALDAAGDGTAETELGVGTVACALSVDASTASRLVDQAVRGGYLQRQAAATDARRTRLELTNTGTKLVERAIEIRRRWLSQITAGWSPQEVETLAGLLRRFIDDATVSEDLPG